MLRMRPLFSYIKGGAFNVPLVSYLFGPNGLKELETLTGRAKFTILFSLEESIYIAVKLL